jgi:hypothetical protein
MKDLFPKFIIENDNLIISKVTFHKDMVSNVDKVRGGGWFKYDHPNRTYTFYGKSEEFGYAKVEDIKKCIENGMVFTNKYLIHDISKKFKFVYDYKDGSEIIYLN